MKKFTAFFILLLIAGTYSFSQKKSGTVYSEHETIDKTRELWKAVVSGDAEKLRSFFADSAYVIRNNNDSPKLANEQIGKGLAEWASSFENLEVGDQKPAAPDAIEYKDGIIWVQDWLLMTGIHKKTGIVLDLPIHNLYSFNEEGKITAQVQYFNNNVFEDIGHSQTIRENGKVYINHPHIATVRKVMNAYVAKDMEEWKSYYSAEARFTTASMEWGETIGLEEYWEAVSGKFHKDGLKIKLEQFGYPDCIYYEESNQYVVYSWWKVTVWKEGKKHVVPFMLSHSFDQEGKITFEAAYISSNHLDKF
jgi:hypothetical protein